MTLVTFDFYCFMLFVRAAINGYFHDQYIFLFEKNIKLFLYDNNNDNNNKWQHTYYLLYIITNIL